MTTVFLWENPLDFFDTVSVVLSVTMQQRPGCWGPLLAACLNRFLSAFCDTLAGGQDLPHDIRQCLFSYAAGWRAASKRNQNVNFGLKACI